MLNKLIKERKKVLVQNQKQSSYIICEVVVFIAYNIMTYTKSYETRINFASAMKHDGYSSS